MEGGRKVLVILDGMDFLTAGMGAEVEEVMAMVAEIREVSSHEFIDQQSPNGASATAFYNAVFGLTRCQK